MQIHRLTLAARDCAGQALFWSQTLGLPVREVEGGAVDVLLRASAIRFEPAPPNLDPRYHVAEIGVATHDTAATRRAIQDVLGADVLWGGREGWRLTAIGDDRGVVIVAPAGRGWIPVGLAAEPLPTTILAEGPRSRETTLPEGPYRIRAVTAPRSPSGSAWSRYRGASGMRGPTA